MDSAPIFTALFTLSSSISRSLQSLEVPRFTLILVRSMEPIPFGSRQQWFLLAGIATRPSATKAISSFTSNCSFSATFFISFVTMPFLAASICVVYSISSSSLQVLYKYINIRLPKRLPDGRKKVRPIRNGPCIHHMNLLSISSRNISLRWHYPNQVRSVEVRLLPLSLHYKLPVVSQHITAYWYVSSFFWEPP